MELGVDAPPERAKRIFPSLFVNSSSALGVRAGPRPRRMHCHSLLAQPIHDPCLQVGIGNRTFSFWRKYDNVVVSSSSKVKERKFLVLRRLERN